MKYALTFQFPDGSFRRPMEKLLKATAGERGKSWAMSKPKKFGNSRTTYTVKLDDDEAAVQLRLTYSEYEIRGKS